MRALGLVIVGFFNIITIPLIALNMLGGIACAIWLAILGLWNDVFAGIAIIVAGTASIQAALWLSYRAQIAGVNYLHPDKLDLIHANRPTIGACLIVIGWAWTYGVMFFWILGIFALFADSRAPILLLMLGAYCLASGPWGLMLRKNKGAPGSIISVYAGQFGCAAMMAAVLFWHVPQTIPALIPYLSPFLVAGLVLQMGLAVVLAGGARVEMQKRRAVAAE